MLSSEPEKDMAENFFSVYETGLWFHTYETGMKPVWNQYETGYETGPPDNGYETGMKPSPKTIFVGSRSETGYETGYETEL